MKKISASLAFVLTLNLNINGQDVINPYVSTQTAYPFLYFNNQFQPIQLGNWIGVNNYTFDWGLTHNGPGGFLGEYEINMGNHFWWSEFVSPYPNDYSLSYQYELVSFPFSVPCAFMEFGCDYNHPSNQGFPQTDRKLYMPNQNSYNPSINAWEYLPYPSKLYRQTPFDAFAQGQYSSGFNGGGSYANSLVTGAFPNANGLAGTTLLTERKGIPHSVIKHTVNLHCGSTPTQNNIITSFSFYYDNTRGGMRYYPFI